MGRLAGRLGQGGLSGAAGATGRAANAAKPARSQGTAWAGGDCSWGLARTPGEGLSGTGAAGRVATDAALVGSVCKGGKFCCWCCRCFSCRCWSTGCRIGCTGCCTGCGTGCGTGCIGCSAAGCTRCIGCGTGCSGCGTGWGTALCASCGTGGTGGTGVTVWAIGSCTGCGTGCTVGCTGGCLGCCQHAPGSRSVRLAAGAASGDAEKRTWRWTGASVGAAADARGAAASIGCGAAILEQAPAATTPAGAGLLRPGTGGVGERSEERRRRSGECDGRRGAASSDQPREPPDAVLASEGEPAAHPFPSTSLGAFVADAAAAEGVEAAGVGGGFAEGAAAPHLANPWKQPSMVARQAASGRSMAFSTAQQSAERN